MHISLHKHIQVIEIYGHHRASENSVSVLDPHGERSLGVSPVRILRMTGEGRGVNGIRSRRSSVPQCKVQREAPPRRTINRIQKKKKKMGTIEISQENSPGERSKAGQLLEDS